jgi:hypothetical protein
LCHAPLCRQGADTSVITASPAAGGIIASRRTDCNYRPNGDSAKALDAEFPVSGYAGMGLTAGAAASISSDWA